MTRGPIAAVLAAVLLGVPGVPGNAAADDLARGRVVFRRCVACHSVDPQEKSLPGPNLFGIVGRHAGNDPGHDYSPVLRAARRVWSDSKGNIWVSEWNSGNVSVYDPGAKTWKQWKLPGNGPRTYAVYVDETDAVWLSEWTAQAMVRFDPATEKFEVFKSDKSSANVRQILGRKGEVWVPESGADRLVVYRFK